MHRTRAFALGLSLVSSGFFLLALLVAPHLAAAQAGTLQTGFSIVPSICNCFQGAGWGCVLSVIKNLLTFAIYIGVIGSVLAIAYGGFLLITNPVNSSNRTKARGVLIDAVIGLVIVLAAYLIVNTLFTVLTTTTLSAATATIGGTSGNCLPTATDQQGTTQGVTGLSGSATANSISTAGCPGSLICTSGTCQPDPQLDNGDGSAGAQCNNAPNSCQSGLVCDNTGVCSQTAVSSTPVPTSCVNSSASSGGTCSVASGGACDPSQLGAFGSQANQASQVCMGESSGRANIGSTGDIMSNDPQHRAFSWGLFQINITVNPVGGLNCPAAFNGKNYSATVKDEGLYAQCVAAASDPTQNIAEAVAIWSKDNGSFHEWGAATKCGISFLDGGPLVAFASCSIYTSDTL